MDQSDRARLAEDLRKKNLPWQIGTEHSSGASLKWFSVLDLASGIKLGLSWNANWVRKGPQSVIEFAKGISPVFLLPMLEMPRDSLHEHLTAALSSMGLSKDLINALPIEDTIATALESGSEHWVGLGLDWAANSTPSERLQNEVLKLATNGPTQALRHAAKKLSGKWTRSTTPSTANGEEFPNV